MTRFSARIEAVLPSIVKVDGSDQTFTCNTLDVSPRGLFLETEERVAESSELTISIIDLESGGDIVVQGIVVRVIDEPRQGLGVHVIEPTPYEWGSLVERLLAVEADTRTTGTMRVLVVVERPSGGLRAFYACSGWDVQFATSVEAARAKLEDVDLSVVIADFAAADGRWREVLSMAAARRPNARRILRAHFDAELNPTNLAAEALLVLSTLPDQVPSASSLANDPLIHRLVEADTGLEALLDAITASFEIE